VLLTAWVKPCRWGCSFFPVPFFFFFPRHQPNLTPEQRSTITQNNDKKTNSTNSAKSHRNCAKQREMMKNTMKGDELASKQQKRKMNQNNKNTTKTTQYG
jgi:hypothetical protein